MQYTENMRRASSIIFPTMVILQILLVGFQWLPTRQAGMSALHTVDQQQTRSQSIEADAMVIDYITDPSTRSQAISSIETILPLFEADQAAMSNYRDPGVQAVVSQSQGDYLAIDVAAKLILSQSHGGTIDRNQIAIILAHSDTYAATMNAVAIALKQASSDALWRLFYIEASLDGALIVLVVTIALILRGNAKRIQPELLRKEQAS